jgi:uncharacterized surface anchored protein
VTVNSPTASTFTLNASTVVVFTDGTNNATVNRSTSGNSGPSGTGPSTKRFVDAAISITPDATNGITEPHTFIVTVTKNLGSGGGFVAAAGEHVTATLTDAGGAVHSSPTGSCTTAGPNTDANGQCTITFTSNSAGTVTGNASVTINFGGNATAVTRDTDPVTPAGHGPDGSGPATKTFVQGFIIWHKVDHHSVALGGATFQVCATAGTAASAGHTPLCASVVDNTGQAGYTGLDDNAAPGEFRLNKYQSLGGSALGGLAMGTYTIQETQAPQGYSLDPNIHTVTLTLANPSADAGTFTDVRLFRMVVYTCSENGPTIIPSTVTLTGQSPATRDTIDGVPSNLAVKGVTMADLCDLGTVFDQTGKANFGSLDANTYGPSVVIPKP